MRPYMLGMSRKVRGESPMRRDQPQDRARPPRMTRRRALLVGLVAAGALSLLAACGDDKSDSGKFKLRSGASW